MCARRRAWAQSFKRELFLGPPRPTPLVSPGLRHRCAGPAAPQRPAAVLANHRPADLVPPLGNPDAAPAGQHPDPGARCRRGRDGAGGEPGLAHQPLRIPRTALAGLGADAALCDSGLRAGVRLCWAAGFCRPRADPAAGVVRHWPAIAAGALPGRGDPGIGAGLLSLRLSARSHRVPGPGQGPDGSGTGARSIPLAGVLARGHAHGASRPSALASPWR